MRNIDYTRVIITLATLGNFITFMSYTTVFGIQVLELKDIVSCIIYFVLTCLGAAWLINEYVEN